jgi:hypothetical protein
VDLSFISWSFGRSVTIFAPSGVAHSAAEQWRCDCSRRSWLGCRPDQTKALLSIAENDEYRETAKQIEPMLKAVAELDAKEEAERIARQRAEANLSLAREAAKARALENVDNDAAVISARERLGEVSSWR